MEKKLDSTSIRSEGWQHRVVLVLAIVSLLTITSLLLMRRSNQVVFRQHEPEHVKGIPGRTAPSMPEAVRKKQ